MNADENLHKIPASLFLYKTMKLGHDLTNGKRTQDVRIKANVDFDRFLLKPYVLEGLRECGFLIPSPIQYQAIPLTSCGFDMLLEAKAGTGKTVVFCVRALQLLDFTKGLQAIILAPTREIAAQICDVIKQIGAKCEGLRVEVVMGGLPLQDDIENLKNTVHIVVGSPGRLHHLIKDGYLDVTTVRLLIIDEADKLMEKSFKADIDYIFCKLPKEKQVIMSSATYPEKSLSLIKNFVPTAHHVCPEKNSILVGVNQAITVVDHNINVVTQTQIKFKELLKILSTKNFKQCLIYCNYQARVVDVHKLLVRNNWPAESLHGGQKQTHRLDALKSLQDYTCRILISTDLAARGLDSSNLDLIINFEVPHDWQTYLHRIGRAGRFGQYGDAINIVSSKEEDDFYNVIESIKEFINLRELWSGNLVTGKKYDECLTQINDSVAVDSVSPINTILSGEDVKFWDEITSQEEDTDDPYETLSDLQRSLEEFNDKDDTHITSNNEKVQNDLNFSILSLLDRLYKVNNKTQESVQIINEAKESTEPKMKLNKEYIEKTKALNSVDVPIGTQNGDIPIGNGNVDISIGTHNVDITHGLHKENNTTVTGNEYWNTSAALLNAGLPTSFESMRNKKNKKNRSKKNNSYNEEKFEKLENEFLDEYETLMHQTCESAKNKNIVKKVSKQNKNKDKISPISLNICTSEPRIKKKQKNNTKDTRTVHFESAVLPKYENDYKELVTRIKQKQLENETCLLDDAFFVFSSDYYDHNSDDNDDSEGNIVDYDTWFSKLKMNTNYIERELYREMYVK